MSRQLVAVVLVAAAAACSPAREEAGGAVRIEVTVAPRPPVTGTARVEVSLRDLLGRPVEAAGVEIAGDMAHPGMRPSLATARREGPGEWRADLELTMPGDWFVGVEARLEDGSTVRRTIELPGVGSP